MRTWTTPAKIEKLDEEDYLVTFPDMPEAITGGRTLEDARRNAADALEEAVLCLLALGRPIPLPRDAHEDEETIILDSITAARAVLGIANSGIVRGN